MLEIQKKMLVLLKEIDTICKKHNITWFLMYGTLLGAVRHRGFIPWDDDADIVMTHENWIKFRQAFSQDPLPERTLTNIDIDASQYGHTFARYHDISREKLMKQHTIFTAKNGIFIDIFILDNFPDDVNAKKEYHQTFLDFCELAPKFYCPSLYLPGKNRYRNKIGPLLLQNRQKALQKYINKLSSLGDESTACYIQRYCVNHIYPRELLSESLYITFEDTTLPIPKRYYEVLCLQYGESWMYVPERHSQFTHPDILSAKISKDWPIVQQFHKNRGGVLHQLVYLGAKLVNTTYYPVYRDWKLSSRSLAAAFVRYSLSSNSELNREERIMFYLRFQINPWFVGRYVASGWWNWYNHTMPTLIEVDDDLLIDSLEYLLDHDGLHLASMLLQAISHAEKKKPPRLVLLEELADSIKRANAALYIGDYQKALSVSEQALGSWHHNLSLWRTHIAAGYFANPEKFTVPPNLPKHIVKDPEIALVRAEIALRERQAGNALRHMRTCARGTRNGMLFRRLLETGKELHLLLARRADLQASLLQILGRVSKTLGEPSPDWMPEIHVKDIFKHVATPSTAPQKIAAAVQEQARAALRKQYALLEELSKLCEACGVRYHLFGNALRFAAAGRRLQAEPVRLSIAVNAHGCRRLLKYHKKYILPHRYLESPISNPDFPEFALYYGDTQSMELDSAKYGFRQHHGMHIDVRILPVEQLSLWRKHLRVWTETTWAMEHGLMPVTVGRLVCYALFTIFRLVFGKRRVAYWLFRKVFLKGRLPFNPEDNFHIFWKKKFLTLPIKWFSGSHTGKLEEKSFPVPSPAYQPALLKKLYGAQWDPACIKPPTDVDPFCIGAPELSYDGFFLYLKNSSCNVEHIWKQRVHIIHFGWFRSLFQRKLTKDWNYLLFLNERYSMYKAVLPLKKKILRCLARGNTKELTQIMSSSVMKTCLNKTEQYLAQGLCFNFDPEIFNVVIEHYRNNRHTKKANLLFKLNKKQKYSTIRYIDVAEKDASL